MKKLVAWGSFAMLTLALTGCATDGEPAENPAASATSASESTAKASVTAQKSTETPVGEPATEENLSERGNRVIAIGDEVTITGKEGNELVKYKVNGLKPTPKCTNHDWEPTNGYFMTMDIEAETFTGVDEISSQGWRLYPGDFKQILKDDTTSNADASSTSALNCLLSKETIGEMGNKEKAKGSIVLDLAETEGTLIYNTWQEGGTWELEIPTK